MAPEGAVRDTSLAPAMAVLASKVGLAAQVAAYAVAAAVAVART